MQNPFSELVLIYSFYRRARAITFRDIHYFTRGDGFLILDSVTLDHTVIERVFGRLYVSQIDFSLRQCQSATIFEQLQW
jgi:hypothetical protein